MADLIFYTNPQSRGRSSAGCSRRSAQPYETEVIPTTTTMKSEPYLAINPMGKVPAIKHNGHVVTECAAICAYLADAFPEASLARRPTRSADYYRWIFYAAGPLEAAFTTRQWAGRCPPSRNACSAMAISTRSSLSLDELFSHRDYVCGDRFTAADVYVGSQTHVSDAVRNASRAQELPFIPRPAAGPASLQARERDRREDHRRDGPASAAASASVEILTTRCGLRCAR